MQDPATGETAIVPPSRGRPRRNHSVFRILVGGGLFVLASVLVVFTGSHFTQYTVCLVAIFALVTVSQEWLIGRAGQISIGAAAMMAVGAYVTAKLSTQPWAVFPLPPIIALVVGCIAGLVVGIPGLRLRGLYLVLTTLALQFIVAFAGQRYQGVANEGGFYVTPSHWGSTTITAGRPFLIACLAILALVLLLLEGIYSGAPGRAWNALRQNELAASVLGVNPVRWKLAAFACSSGLAALGGSLYAYQSSSVTYEAFSLDLAVGILIAVFVGGIGTATGALIGAVVIVELPQQLQRLSASFSGNSSVGRWFGDNGAFVASAIYGLLLLLVLLYERGGIFAVLRRVGRLTVRAVIRISPPHALEKPSGNSHG